MPPKQCGRCSKTVYPTEELKCLDKVWHKGCFKCQVCNMTLNMKNYKGYNKLPYCNTHYPQTKFTAVADTPEMRRIADNTKIQSNLTYTKDFEASKGKCTQISDTPEMRTMMRNTQNIKYHEEFEKQKGKKIQIADDPEMQRVRQNMNIISNVTYHGDLEKRQQMERARPAEQVEGQAQMQNRASDYNPAASQVRASNPGRIADYDPQEYQGGGGGGTPYSARNSGGAKQVYDSTSGRGDPRVVAYQAYGYYNRVQRFSSSADDEQLEQPPSRKVGSISDYDPMNENYGSIVGQYSQYPPQGQMRRGQPGGRQQGHPQSQPQGHPQQMPPPQAYQPPPQPQPPAPAASKGMVCRAIYDYSAADSDEVSFQEGDLIIFCQPIDQGWMEGTVEKTGDTGMLPSNYVEQI